MSHLRQKSVESLMKKSLWVSEGVKNEEKHQTSREENLQNLRAKTISARIEDDKFKDFETSCKTELSPCSNNSIKHNKLLRTK